MTGEQYSSRFASALSYAALAHAGQMRKGTSIPYISHPMSVSALVLEMGGDEDQAIAGLLHDVLEDCGSHHEMLIRNSFGDRVANIVLACTDGVPDPNGKKEPWKERKLRYLQRLRNEPLDALLVSACDKLHNARSIVTDLEQGHDVFSRFSASRSDTIWYYQELKRIFRERLGNNCAMTRKLSQSVDAFGA